MEDSREDTAVIQLKVRMREWLRARLEEQAKTHGTSINAEVINFIRACPIRGKPSLKGSARRLRKRYFILFVHVIDLLQTTKLRVS